MAYVVCLREGIDAQKEAYVFHTNEAMTTFLCCVFCEQLEELLHEDFMVNKYDHRLDEYFDYNHQKLTLHVKKQYRLDYRRLAIMANYYLTDTLYWQWQYISNEELGAMTVFA